MVADTYDTSADVNPQGEGGGAWTYQGISDGKKQDSQNLHPCCSYQSDTPT